MTIIGTSHFVSFEAACTYYTAYGETAADVQAKLDTGEIHIGRPQVALGEFAAINREEGRYFIRSENYRQREAREFAERVKAMGFTVYMAESGEYGFLTDETESRVLSFGSDGSLGGNYGPPSRESGTGWRMDKTTHDMRSTEDVRKALYEQPPHFCGKGWKRLSSVKDMLAHYGPSSRYVKLA